MRKQLYIFLLFLLMILSGCNSSVNNNSNHEPSKNLEKKEIDTILLQDKSLDKKILPPQFIITNFDLKYTHEKEELIFHMNYEIDTDIYSILTEGKQKLYFALEYPEHVSAILNAATSEQILAEEPKNFNNKYQAVFKVNINLDEKKLQKVKENLSSYNLIVFDKEKSPVAKFIDLNGFNGYDSESSKNSHIDDTNK